MRVPTHAARNAASRVRTRIRERRGDIRAQLHGASLLLPFDHALPGYVKLFPEYSSNVVRVAEAVVLKYPDSPLIDVGANVGDTVGFWRARLDAPILAVEGDPHWMPYLTANTDALAGVTLAPVFMGAETARVRLRADRLAGTSAFVPDDEIGTAVEICTPRDLLDRFPAFRAARVVKSDTDGFDYAIVSSFVGELPQRPVFFFEHDPSLGSLGLEQSHELRRNLVGAGYEMTLWWDNFGRFLLACDLRDELLWDSLSRYVPAPQSIHYWDVAAFADADSDLAESLRLHELARLQALRRKAGGPSVTGRASRSPGVGRAAR